MTNAQQTFKIGQRVELRSFDSNGPRGTVTAIHDDGAYVVAWDDGHTFVYSVYSVARLHFLLPL